MRIQIRYLTRLHRCGARSLFFYLLYVHLSKICYSSWIRYHLKHVLFYALSRALVKIQWQRQRQNGNIHLAGMHFEVPVNVRVYY